MEFIAKYVNEIDLLTYTCYNISMLRYAKSYIEAGKYIDSSIVNYYKSEASKHIEILSFVNYIDIIQPLNNFEKIGCTINYLWTILKYSIKQHSFLTPKN